MEIVRFGLLGCGDIARKRVATAIQGTGGCQLIAASRRSAAALDAFCREFEISNATTDRTTFVERADIDAVYVATPVHSHCDDVVACAEAGKHVLVEKPMALTVDQCDHMIRVCAAHGVTLSVAYYRRFYPIVARMKQLLAENTLGTPLSIRATVGNSSDFPADDWRVTLATGGGGPLMDIGSHRLDLFIDLMGTVESVYGFADSVAASFEAEDCATTALRFANRAHGVLQCYFGTSDVPDALEIIGTRGRLSTSDLNAGRLQIDRNGTSTVEHHAPHRNLHAPLIEDFARAIRTRTPPTITGDAGREVNRIIQASYASSR